MAKNEIEFSDADLQALCTKLGCTEAITEQFLRLQLQNVVLFDKKQASYGSKNIAAFGFLGCVVRMSDKFERIKNLFGKKRKSAINESMIDNLDDISNYAMIAKMCYKGTWPK